MTVLTLTVSKQPKVSVINTATARLYIILVSHNDVGLENRCFIWYFRGHKMLQMDAFVYWSAIDSNGSWVTRPKVQYRAAGATATSAHCTTVNSAFPFIIIFTSRLSWSTAGNRSRRGVLQRVRSSPSHPRPLPALNIEQSVTSQAWWGRELIILEYIVKDFTRPHSIQSAYPGRLTAVRSAQCLLDRHRPLG